MAPTSLSVASTCRRWYLWVQGRRAAGGVESMVEAGDVWSDTCMRLMMGQEGSRERSPATAATTANTEDARVPQMQVDIDKLQTWVAAVSQRPDNNLPSTDEVQHRMQAYAQYDLSSKRGGVE